MKALKDSLVSVAKWVTPIGLVAGILGWTEAASTLPDELTIDQATEIALRAHPSLEAALAAVSGREGLVSQSQVRPNPTLHVQAENWRFSNPSNFPAAERLDFFAYVAQPLETAGKRKFRMTLARHDQAIAELKRRAVEWEVRQRVKQAFWEALLAQREVELLAESNRYFRQFVDFHRIRVREGSMAEADLIRVELEQERLNVAHQAAELSSQEARLELLRTMGGGDTDTGFKLAPPPTARPVEGGETHASLIARANRNRLEVALARAEVDRARAWLEREQARAKPDVNVLFGYKRTEGDNMLLGGVSIPLPLLDTNQGNISFSRSGIDQAMAQLRVAMLGVQADVSASLAALHKRHAMVSRMEATMAKRAEESLDIALSAYREGAGNLLRVLDAQRAQIEVRLLLSRTRLELEQDVVRLESAVGEENLALGPELLGEVP